MPQRECRRGRSSVQRHYIRKRVRGEDSAFNGAVSVAVLGPFFKLAQLLRERGGRKGLLTSSPSFLGKEVVAGIWQVVLRLHYPYHDRLDLTIGSTQPTGVGLHLPRRPQHGQDVQRHARTGVLSCRTRSNFREWSCRRTITSPGSTPLQSPLSSE